MSAYGELTHALDALDEAAERVPCRDRRRSARWTSDEADDLEWAAFHCRSLHCPVLALCAQAADELKARHHVWGGQVRTPKPRGKAA